MRPPELSPCSKVRTLAKRQRPFWPRRTNVSTREVLVCLNPSGRAFLLGLAPKYRSFLTVQFFLWMVSPNSMWKGYMRAGRQGRREKQNFMLRGHLDPPLSKTTLRTLLKTSKKGDSAVGLGNLCQCSFTHTVKKCFLTFRWNTLYFSLQPLPLVLTCRNAQGDTSKGCECPRPYTESSVISEKHSVAVEVPSFMPLSSLASTHLLY